MTAAEYQRYSEIFDRFSAERHVVDLLPDPGAVGGFRSYDCKVAMLDKTAFILAAIEMSKNSAQTVSGQS